MSNNLELGTLKITISTENDEPVAAKFEMPDGSIVTRPFPETGELDMKLGLGLGLSVAPSAGSDALAISGTPVLTATEDEAYAGFTVSATGGTEPYTFSVASGALPAGITLDADTGAVAGTPTESGTFPGIVIRVTDAAMATDDLDAFAIEVEAAPVVAPQTKSGTFTGSGSTGNQAITGIGFQPELLIIITDLSSNDTAAADAHFALGMASGASNQQALHFSDNGGVATTETSRSQQSGKIVSITNAAGSAVVVEAALASFDADGFTLNWTLASAAVYHYIAIAGGDFQAKVGSFDMNGSTGTQAVTGVGFQPKAVMFFGAIDNTTEGAQAQAKLTMGCMTGAAERWATAQYDQDALGASNSIAQEYFTESKCIVRINETTVTLAADFESFDADGFTVDITTALACRMAYVAFGGSIDYHAGTVTQPTSNGAVAETGVGHEPDAVIFAGFGGAALDTIADDCQPTFGWCDQNLDEACVAVSVNDNVGTSDSHRDQGAGACIERVSPTGNTVVTQAGMQSFAADGFTLNWAATDATASIIGYLSMGVAA